MSGISAFGNPFGSIRIYLTRVGKNFVIGQGANRPLFGK